jgi:hypothetical protein
MIGINHKNPLSWIYTPKLVDPSQIVRNYDDNIEGLQYLHPLRSPQLSLGGTRKPERLGWRTHLEVVCTSAQISHDANTRRGAICSLKAGNVRGKQCFEIVQVIRATVYEISCDLCR